MAVNSVYIKKATIELDGEQLELLMKYDGEIDTKIKGKNAAAWIRTDKRHIGEKMYVSSFTKNKECCVSIGDKMTSFYFLDGSEERKVLFASGGKTEVFHVGDYWIRVIKMDEALIYKEVNGEKVFQGITDLLQNSGYEDGNSGIGKVKIGSDTESGKVWVRLTLFGGDVFEGSVDEEWDIEEYKAMDGVDELEEEDYNAPSMPVVLGLSNAEDNKYSGYTCPIYYREEDEYDPNIFKQYSEQFEEFEKEGIDESVDLSKVVWANPVELEEVEVIWQDYTEEDVKIEHKQKDDEIRNALSRRDKFLLAVCKAGSEVNEEMEELIKRISKISCIKSEGLFSDGTASIVVEFSRCEDRPIAINSSDKKTVQEMMAILLHRGTGVKQSKDSRDIVSNFNKQHSGLAQVKGLWFEIEIDEYGKEEYHTYEHIGNHMSVSWATGIKQAVTYALYRINQMMS
jgi:hypothetical protein